MRTSRELAIALRAGVTWTSAAVGALVVGHGFVLAVDVFSASSRSALANELMHREMDPLAAVVRPTLGGAELAVAVLVPIVAARVLAVEKERGTFGALALAARSTSAIVARKLVAASCASLLVVAPAVACIAAFGAVGGHVDVLETGVAVLGHAAHAVLVACVGVAAAAWTRTTAQATSLALVVSLASWVVSAGEGLSALAWTAPLEALSVSRALAPLEHGIVAVGSIVWFAVAAATAIAAAVVGARIDLAWRPRAGAAILLAVTAAFALHAAGNVTRAYDWTEYRRASLPPGVVDALRAIPGTIHVEVFLDREDSRRRQLERDVLTKLRLARADLAVDMPLDERSSSLARDEDYGKIVLRVGGARAETRSTSRKEIVTRICELAGRPAPDFAQAAYPGYPLVPSGGTTRAIRIFSYGVSPAVFLVLGALVTRRRGSRDRALQDRRRPPPPSRSP